MGVVTADFVGNEVCFRRRCQHSNRRVRRASKPLGKPLAAADMAAPRKPVEIACGHVFDHALPQRHDGGIGTHGELLSIKVGNLDLQDSLPGSLPHLSAASTRLGIAQRFSAMAVRARNRSSATWLVPTWVGYGPLTQPFGTATVRSLQLRYTKGRFATTQPIDRYWCYFCR